MKAKDAYVKKLHEKIDEWSADIDKLNAEADEVEAASRAEFNRQMENLRMKRQTVERKIAELRDAGEGAWEDLKAGTQIAWDALEEALKSAQSRFR